MILWLVLYELAVTSMLTRMELILVMNQSSPTLYSDYSQYYYSERGAEGKDEVEEVEEE
jgi:hypothetical protein